MRDYPTFSGRILERYFRNKLIEEGVYTRIGGFWDRKGLNEIDLIAMNELSHTARIIEVKRNPANMDMEKLRRKGDAFQRDTGQLNDYQIEYAGLSMEDM
jgi:hypothetical protein